MGLNETVPSGVQADYYYESQAPIMYGTGVFFMVICLGSVGLRFWARKVANMPYGLDDWFALAAVPFTFAIIIVNLSTIAIGGGRHNVVVYNTDGALMNEWLKRIFIVAFFYNAAIALFKLSILALYIRLFGVCNKLRWTCIIVGASITAWFIVTEMVLLFRCHPISGQWNPAGSTCIMTFPSWNAISSIPAVVFGTITLIIPIRLVWEMKLNLFQRTAVSGVFILGAVDVVISICRMIYAFRYCNAKDKMWETVIMDYWSAAEPTAGILSCCLLTYAPLFRAFCRDSPQKWTVQESSSDAHRRRSSKKYLKSRSNESLPESNEDRIGGIEEIED